MVGKSDFNENPVVSLDFDFDYGLRLRVCQFRLELYNSVRIFFDLSLFDSLETPHENKHTYNPPYITCFEI